MKVAIITPFPPYRGGISKHSENLYKELTNLSIDTTVLNFTRQYPGIFFPGKNQYLNNFTPYDSKHIIRVIDSINPISWRKTAKIIIDKKINRLIFRYWNPFFIPCYIYIIKYLRRKKHNIKIYSICDNIISHETFYLQKYFVRKFITLLDGVITMSTYVKKQMIDLVEEVNCKNLFLPIVNDLGEKIDISLAKKELHLDTNKVTFLFFGLIREYKGLDILLEAINRIDKNLCQNYELLIVGESYVDINKYKKILDSDLHTNISWYNKYIPDEFINLYFSASNYVVLPYRSGSQSGIIPIAYYYNKPVIASNVNGLVEFINENTGLIFENENIKELASILEDCIKNYTPDLFKNMDTMKNKLSTSNYTKEILEFIK